MNSDPWHYLSPKEKSRQMMLDIVTLQDKLIEMIDEHEWAEDYLVAVVGGWLTFVFNHRFPEEEFLSFIDKMLLSHKERANHE